MGLKIQLPTADLIGVAGATTSVIDGTTTTLVPNTIYVAQPGDGVTFTVALPTTDLSDGSVILIKDIGLGQVDISTALIEGTNQTLEITNNTPVRLVYHSSSIGWIIT